MASPKDIFSYIGQYVESVAEIVRTATSTGLAAIVPNKQLPPPPGKGMIADFDAPIDC